MLYIINYYQIYVRIDIFTYFNIVHLQRVSIKVAAALAS